MVDARRNRCVFLAVNLDHVKPRLLFGRVLLQPRLRSGDDLRLLGRCDGFARRTVAGVFARLDLRKDNILRVLRDNVNLTEPSAEIRPSAVCQPCASRYCRAAFSPHAPFIAVLPDAFRKIS